MSEVSADRLPSELGSEPASDVPAGGTSASAATRAMPVLWFVAHVTPDQRQNDTGAEAAAGHANVFDLGNGFGIFTCDPGTVRHEKAAPMLEQKVGRIQYHELSPPVAPNRSSNTCRSATSSGMPVAECSAHRSAVTIAMVRTRRAAIMSDMRLMRCIFEFRVRSKMYDARRRRGVGENSGLPLHICSIFGKYPGVNTEF